MTIIDTPLDSSEGTDRDAALIILIDQALADFSHLSIIDATAVQDVLLDLRRTISG